MEVLFPRRPPHRWIHIGKITGMPRSFFSILFCEFMKNFMIFLPDYQKNTLLLWCCSALNPLLGMRKGVPMVAG